MSQMNKNTKKKSPTGYSIGRSPLRFGLMLSALTIACLALSPVTEGKQPSEDRGNGNSAAENVQALNLGTSGADNTAHGWFSLSNNTGGFANTADGFQALQTNTTGSDNTADGAFALFSNSTGS